VCVPSLYTIFWHLSSYALHLTLQRDHPTYVVPTLTLPSLADHALFPHTIKAMKTHIVRQSQLYITKLQRMQTAEEGWRAAAADITAEYQSCQAQMAELVVPAAPRIPGQPVPEIESDRMLFSAPAHAEVSIHPLCCDIRCYRHHRRRLNIRVRPIDFLTRPRLVVTAHRCAIVVPFL
jgi:hypothetical protein